MIKIKPSNAGMLLRCAIVLQLWLTSGASAAWAQRRMPQLEARGPQIVEHESGKPVVLRGTNFGGWLLIERWIVEMDYPLGRRLEKCGKQAGISNIDKVWTTLGDWDMSPEAYLEAFRRVAKAVGTPAQIQTALDCQARKPHIPDELHLWQTLEQRFGREKMLALKAAFRSNWITERDVALVAGMGMNVARLPFWYTLLEDDERPFQYKLEGWRQIDEVLTWCEKHRVYAILDLHGAQGSQSVEDHTGVQGRNALWGDPLAKKRMVALWRAIAARYKDRTVVAGYDLLNEPMGVDKVEPIISLTDRCYEAIREIDRNHIIFIEDGYHGFDKFPEPKTMHWGNVVYSPHFYGQEARSARALETEMAQFMPAARAWQQKFNVPVLLGEFNVWDDAHGGIPGLEVLIKNWEKNAWSWTVWTYKKVMAEGKPTDNWGIYYNAAPWDYPDFYEDSYEMLAKKFQNYNTRNFEPNAAYLRMLKGYLQRPW